MKILDRYIRLHIAGGYLLVMAVLISLFTFLDFIDQLDDMGKGDYRLRDIIVFVVLMAPRRLLDLMPATALLGGTLALGSLAGSNQLVAMRAAGVSVAQIGWAVMKAGLMLVLAVVVLTEFIVPPLQQKAYERQLITMGRIRALRTDQGFWSRDGMRFINIRQIRNGRIPTDINIYEFNERGQLQNFIHAENADIIQRDHWILNGVWRKTVDGQTITMARLPSQSWRPFLDDAQFQALQYPADSLSPSDLYQYIHYLQSGKQDTRPYELQFWQKVALPFTTGAMALLSIPFVFSLPRLSNAGQRILAGAITGIVLYFLNLVIANLGMLLNLNIPLLVLFPVLMILGFAWWLLRRV